MLSKHNNRDPDGEALHHADSDVTEKRRVSAAADTSGGTAHFQCKSLPSPGKKLSQTDIRKFSTYGHIKRNENIVGLAEGLKRATGPSAESLDGSLRHRVRFVGKSCPKRDYLSRTQKRGSIDDDEQYARSKVERRPFVLLIIGYWTAFKIFLYYLISLSSLLTCGLTVGLTIFWYNRFLVSDFGSFGILANASL